MIDSTAAFGSVTRLAGVLALATVLGLCAAASGQQDGEMIWDGEQWVPATPPEPGTAMGDLAIIRNNVEAGRVKGVVEQVENFLVQYPESPGAEEAMNLAGQALITRGRYWDAYDWYTRQTSTYPNGAFFQRALHRQYTIADAFLNGRKRRLWKIFRVSASDDALDMLQRIAAAAPGTEIAERALLRAGDHYFDNELYKEAIDVYEQFIRENPASPRRAYAMLQVPKSYLLMYRGVEWEVAPLLDAKKRFEIFAAAYPRAAERENISEILEEIRQIRAHKLYHTGWFYERTKHPRAAAFYYRKLLSAENERGEKMFVDTQWADEARLRLAALGPVESEPAPLPPVQPNRRETQDASQEPAPAAPSADTTTPPGEPPRLSSEINRREPFVEPPPENTTPLGPAPAEPETEPQEEPESTPGPVPIEELPALPG